MYVILYSSSVAPFSANLKEGFTFCGTVTNHPQFAPACCFLSRLSLLSAFRRFPLRQAACEIQGGLYVLSCQRDCRVIPLPVNCPTSPRSIPIAPHTRLPDSLISDMEGLGDDTDGTGYDMPTMMNQPPQIFGTYNPDGSPVPASLPGPIFSDDNAAGNTEENNEVKRRRIARVNHSLATHRAYMRCIDFGF